MVSIFINNDQNGKILLQIFYARVQMRRLWITSMWLTGLKNYFDDFEHYNLLQLKNLKRSKISETYCTHFMNEQLSQAKNWMPHPLKLLHTEWFIC